MAELTQRQKDILIRTALGEARGEGVEGMADVIQVILNRSQSGRYPSDPAAVALQPKQFSTWNKGEGGNNPQQFKPSDPIYKQAAQALDAVVSGSRPDYTGGALFYHTPAVNPKWSTEVNRHGTIQRNGHIFYPSRPVPPAEIPNVVASRMDVTPQTRDVPLPRPRPAMGGDPGGGGLGTLIPRESAMPPLPRPRPSMGSDPGGGVGTLVARVDPNTGQAVSVRDVPLPRPRPIMGGDPGGGGIGELVATIPSTQPLPPQRLPDLPPSTMGRDPSSGQVVSPPIMSKAMVEGATGFRLPQTPPLALAVDPLTEYYNLRGNPDMPKKVPGPSINYTKDQSRLAPGWGTAPTQTAATARSAPIMVGMAQQQPVRLPVATAAPQRIAPIPAPLSQRPPPMMVQQPAPVRLAQGQQAPLQVTVQGANSYNGGSTTPGSATGQQYNVGQSYQAGGYNYVFNNDGSVTNTDTGITRGGGRRSYDPDTNTWQ